MLASSSGDVEDGEVEVEVELIEFPVCDPEVDKE